MRISFPKEGEKTLPPVLYSLKEISGIPVQLQSRFFLLSIAVVADSLHC